MPGTLMRLVGFDENYRAERIGRRLDVRPKEELPGFVERNDLLVVPGLDALYDTTGNRLEVTKRSLVPPDFPPASHTRARVESSYGRYCPETIELPDQFEIIEEPVFFGGHSWNHYGHFVTDVMSRFWALPFVEPTVPILYLDRVSPAFDGQGFSRHVVESLMIGNRLFSCKHPTRLRRAYLPEPAIQHAFRIFHIQAAPHMVVANETLTGAAGEFDGKLVYMTRSGLLDTLRKSPQESQVENHLRSLGFLIVQPERMSLQDQIRMFNHASLIAGMSGSAFHTSLFCNGSTTPTFIQLCWEKINQRYLMIDQIKSTPSIYVKAGTIGSIAGNLRIENIQLDVDTCISAIEAVLKTGEAP